MTDSMKRRITISEIPCRIRSDGKPVPSRGSCEILTGRSTSGKARDIDIEAMIEEITGRSHELPGISGISMDQQHGLIRTTLMGKRERPGSLAGGSPILIRPVIP